MGQDGSSLPGCRVGTLRLFSSPGRLERVEMVEVPLMHSPHPLEGSWEGRRSLQQSPKLPRGSGSTSAGIHRCAQRALVLVQCPCADLPGRVSRAPELLGWLQSRTQTTAIPSDFSLSQPDLPTSRAAPGQARPLLFILFIALPAAPSPSCCHNRRLRGCMCARDKQPRYCRGTRPRPTLIESRGCQPRCDTRSPL